MMKDRRATLLFALPFLAGCAGSVSKPQQAPTPETITAQNVFSARMAGQTWNFQNKLGDITTIAIQGAPASDFIPSNCVVWHYTKNRARAYWQPAADGADLRFVLCPHNDGSWLALASLMHGDTSNPASLTPWSSTQNIEQIAAAPAYLIVPASGSEAVNQRITSYRNHNLQGAETFNSIISDPASTTRDVTWRTDSYIAHTCVAFQNWCGDALISEQWENCDTATWSQGSGCVHEKWYFAPNLGLVRVDIRNVGNGEDIGFCAIDLGVKQCYTVEDISFQRVS